MKQEATNTFGDGMIMDLNPLTTPNNVLTSALNATMITYNGNEFVLQNDMGNGRVETAYLPSGYVPVGIKEYGGIIYVASYNPITNKGQIGSFPSPERNISSNEINKAKDPEVRANRFELSQGQSIFKFKLFGDTGDTVIRSGDKFSIIVTSGTTLNKLKAFVSNCLNVTDGKITSPKNKLLTISVAVFDSNNNLRDITSQLKRIDEDNKVIEFDSTTLPEIKFNSGYYMQCIPDSDITENLVDNYREQYAANTYNNKITGELYIIAKLNTISAIDVSVSGLKNLDKDSEEVEGITVLRNQSLVLLDTTYKYNCPDGYFGPNPADMLDNYISYYGIESDFKSDEGDFSNYISGVEFDLGVSTSRAADKFYLPFLATDNNLLPVYNSDTGMYHSDQSAGYVIDNTEDVINFTATPYMKFGALSGLAVNSSINLSLLGSGIIKVNTWKYFCEQDSVTLTWGLEAYPRTGDEILEVKFIFYDILSTTPESEILEYTLARKRSYNGVFTETLALGNTLQSGHLYLTRVKITTVKGTVTSEYRWLLTTALYNKLYFGTQDFGNSLTTMREYNKVHLAVNNTYGIQNAFESVTKDYVALFNETESTEGPIIDVRQYTKHSSTIEVVDNTSIESGDNYPFTLDMGNLSTNYSLRDDKTTISIPQISYTGSTSNINTLDKALGANTIITPTNSINWDSYDAPEFTISIDSVTGRTIVNAKLLAGLISRTERDSFTFDNPYQGFVDSGDKFNRIFGYDYLFDGGGALARTGVAFNVRKKKNTVWRHMPKFTRNNWQDIECEFDKHDRNVGDNSDKGSQYLNNKTKTKVVEAIDGYFGHRPLCIVVANAGMVSGDAHRYSDSNNGYNKLIYNNNDQTRVEMLWWYNGASYDFVEKFLYYSGPPYTDITEAIHREFENVLIQFGETVTRTLFGPQLITATYNNTYRATLSITTNIVKAPKRNYEDKIFTTPSGFYNKDTVVGNILKVMEVTDDTVDTNSLFDLVDFKLQSFSVDETSEQTYLVGDMIDVYNQLQSIENKTSLPLVAITSKGVVFGNLINNQIYYYDQYENVITNPRVKGQAGYGLVQNLRLGKHEGRVTLLSSPQGKVSKNFYTERDGSSLQYGGIPTISVDFQGDYGASWMTLT